MSRTVDLVRSKPLLLPWWVASGDVEARIVKNVRDLLDSVREMMLLPAAPPVVEVSNVAKMTFDSGREFDLYGWPCLAPPWESWWMEYDYPRSGGVKVSQTRDLASGRLVRSDVEEAALGSQWSVREVDRVAVLFESLPETSWPARREPGDARWCLRMHLLLQPGRDVVGMNAMWHCFLDEHGQAVDFQFMVPRARGVPSEDIEDHRDGVTALLIPVLYALALLHCKNVRTEHVEAPRKVQARRARERKPPLVRYQVVRVEPTLEKVRRVSAGGGGRGESPSLHIVPGGFHHYGQCCGNHERKGLLFGKYEGRYWVPMHARGDPQRGEVRSDYEVKV